MISTKIKAKRVLSEASDSAKIDIEKLSLGRTMIALTESKTTLINQKYPALVGQPITVTEAANKYTIPRNTILEWITKGYVGVIKPGYQMTIDDADMAYCAEIYHHRKLIGIGFGSPLLDENGLPYTLKHPDLSAYRRRRKAN